jgi:ornithine cyclodeaminase/alanine dehydrogenase-like protein (mu-crystallin family)
LFADLARRNVPGRTNDHEITFYANTGNQGLQFAAVGGLMYRNALARGAGRTLPTDWFVQDIRD